MPYVCSHNSIRKKVSINWFLALSYLASQTEMNTKRKKILLCSLLKPANDVRQCLKLAATLATIPNTEVVSVGSKTNTKANFYHNIRLIPAFTYQRALPNRVFNFFKLFKILLQEKPEVIIVSSADLLLVTILYKILFGCVLCYDVQENYSLNLWFSKSWPWFLKYPLAIGVRAVEWLVSPLINQYFLAESVYARQLGFLSPTRSIILENKFQPYDGYETDKSTITKQPYLYLISGTLGPSYLILESISWFLKEVQLHNPKAELIIAGYAPDKVYLKKIHDLVAANPSISLLGGDSLVPYEDIIRLQLKATYGIINLAKIPAMEGKIATKVFEYKANNLIIIDLNYNTKNTKVNLVDNFSNTNLWESNTKELLRIFTKY